MSLTALVFGILVQIGASEVSARWWSDAVHYRTLVDSFKDSDGDGLGDLKGLTKQISYVKALGADAVILSPINAKSKDCSKPGVVDYTQIDERYGNLDELKELIDKATKLDIKVVITLQLQSISETSEFFISSTQRSNGFEDWVVWRDGTPDQTPLTVEGVDKWIWNEDRRAYWGATNDEAVVNLCSDNVASALAGALCAWLRRRVSGVLLNIDHVYDPVCSEKLLKKLASEAFICTRAANMNNSVILIESTLPPEKSARYYDAGANGVLSMALTLPSRSSATELALQVYASLLNSAQDTAPVWLTSSPNGSRITTRYGSELVDAINLLALSLPGAVVIHQGDELGTADSILEWASSTGCWPTKPISSFAPFPWDESSNGGFTTGEPWLPLAPNYRYANAKSEFSLDSSHVGVVRVAAALRKSPAMGPHAEMKRLEGAIAVLRWGDTGSLLVVSNLAEEPTKAELVRIPGIPPQMTVAASSAGSSLSTGAHVNIDKTISLSPGETVLLVGAPRHCGGPGPVDKITSKITEGWQKINKYFSNI